MEPGDILTACLIGLIISPVLALILWALYLLTEGVDGIGRRLYAMLLLLVSAVGLGIVVGVPIVLCAVILGTGLLVVAAATGISLSILLLAAHAFSRATHTGQSPWVTAYLEWIKRVAQGKKAQVQGAKGSGIDYPNYVLPSKTPGNEEVMFEEHCPHCGAIDPALPTRGFCLHCQSDVDEAGAAQQAVLPGETPAPSLQMGHRRVEQIPDDGTELVETAEAYYRDDKVDEAIALCERIIATSSYLRYHERCKRYLESLRKKKARMTHGQEKGANKGDIVDTQGRTTGCS
jgi:hypothetical protein